MQAQHGFVQFDMSGQYFAKVGFGDTQNSGLAVGIGVVGAPVAVKDRHIAKPDARLDIGQGDLLARYGGGADTHRTFGAGDPFLWGLTPGGNQVAVSKPFDIGTAQDVMAQRRRQGREPAPSVDRFAFFDGEDGVVHVRLVLHLCSLRPIVALAPDAAG